jgi:hypothetical protein
MKIKVYGKDYAESIRKFESFIIDTEKYPELTPEVTAIVEASNNGAKPKDLDGLMEELITKMWDTEVEVETGTNSYKMNITECFEPFEQVEWHRFKNEESWLEFERVVDEEEEKTTDPDSEVTKPRWFTDDMAGDNED